MKCCVIVLCCLITPVFTGDGPPKRKPVFPEPIERITITEPGAKVDFHPEIKYCGSSRIDERRVRYFLRHAQSSTDYNYRQALLVGNCSADAVVRFKGGRQIRLSVEDGTGWGRAGEGRSATYLVCEQCDDLLDPKFVFPKTRP